MNGAHEAGGLAGPIRNLLVLFALAGIVAGCMTRTPPAASDAPGASGGVAAPSSAPQPSSGPDAARPSADEAVARAAPPVPARLVGGGAQSADGTSGGPSSQCLAQIEAFAELHSGNRVMLGRAAFAERDQLVLAREPRRGSDGTLLDGRAGMPQPVVINLLAGPDGCSVRLAGSTTGVAGGAGNAAMSGAGPARSAALPACTCEPLPR